MQPKGERKASSAKVEKAPWPPSKRRLRRLVEDAIVDAYGESEERTGLFAMIEEHLVLPFDTEVLGVTVRVVRIDLTVADEIVAICRRGTQRQPLRSSICRCHSRRPPARNGSKHTVCGRGPRKQRRG